jgi:hypothetical protein
MYQHYHKAGQMRHPKWEKLKKLSCAIGVIKTTTVSKWSILALVVMPNSAGSQGWIGV